MAKMGRPKKKIDKEDFEKLCFMQCTEEEICCYFGVCEDTLNTWCKNTYKNENDEPMTFSEISHQKRQGGKISLRRAGFQLAQKNPAVHIFYAKNHLGMTDKVEADFNPESLRKAKELLEGVNSVID